MPELKIFSYVHKNEREAVNFRLHKIRGIIDLCKKDYRWILFTRNLLNNKNPDRSMYDYAFSKMIFDFLKKIPYRKDVAEIETIQYPGLTLEYGGDCDDFCVIGGTMLESIGISVKLAVSKQDPNSPGLYDHIFLIIPTLEDAIFDVTAPAFPGIKTLYRKIKICY